MRLSSCLIFIAGLTGVRAFYPWELQVEVRIEDTVERRFLPWNLIEAKTEDAKPPTLGLKKILVRRDHSYKIVEAYAPKLANSAPLHQDGSDYSYFSSVLVGSQKQELWMALDTGAPNTWVFDSECTETVCTSHHTFNSSNSTSYSTKKSRFSLGYGSGNIRGMLGTDTLSLAGLEVLQEFGQADNASETFEHYPFDGILGLGRSHTNGWTLPSFMDLVAEKKLIKSNLIGFSLSRAADGGKDGEVNFGGVDTTKYDGTISYTLTDANIWSIPVEDAYVNGKSCNFTGKSATIDTGTTYLLIPPSDAATLFSLVPNASQQSGNPNNYVLPCNSTATIEFKFSGVKYSISPKDYVGSTLSENSDFCISTIVGYASNGANWLVGDVFLKNVYTVFDYDNGQIGFGQLASASQPSTTTSSTTTSTGNGTFTPPPVTRTASPANTTVPYSSASHLTHSISWSLLPVIFGALII